MPAPKPVSLTAAAVTTNPPLKSQPLVVVGGLPAATAGARGGVLRGAAVVNATVAADGTSAGTQLNALLAALRTAGIIAP